MPKSGTDGRLVRGERTRTAVLDAAVILATEAGLDGLSLGQLCETLRVSKSGLFAHWKSKEELQLATIEHARTQWANEVVLPALNEPRGLRRLWALHERRMAFYSSSRLPGGCFFGSVEFEYNAKPGVIQDRLAAVFFEWIDLIERLVREAVEVGDLVDTADPKLLAYEIESLGLTASLQSRLLSDAAYTYARRSVLDRLRALSTRTDLLPEDVT
jgi:AcrR family transcriptional regulator